PVLRRAVKDLGLTILILAASQVTVAVDRLFATLLGEGEVSSLSLGFVLIGLVPFLVAAPVYKVMYPELIRLVAANRHEALRKCLSGNLLLVAFLTFPVAAGLAIFSGTITELVFLYGRFSETAASQTAEVIFYLALGLPAGVGVILVFYYFLLTRQAMLLLKVLAVAILANTLLDWVLMSLMGIGGIALTSSLIALIRTWALTLLAARMLGGPIFAGLGVPVGKLLAATLLAGLTMYGTARLFDRVVIAGTAAQIGILATAVALGATVYLAANHMLRNEQLRQLLVRIRQPEAAA
ncbi:MAG: lipid II flippase MurJ, partial [Thermoguttaceae bacterium]